MAFELQTLPDNWKIVKVEHCGEVITGTTPKTERADYYGGDVPFISPMDINGHRFIRKTKTTLTDNGAKEARILPPGSVLVTCIGILGKVGQIDCEATTNQQINSIIPAVRVIMPSYCFWAAHLLKRQLDILAGLQVVPIVNKRVFSNLLMPVPSLPEQRRIAEILDTIDKAIQKTEALISKLKAMKQGLLHDLLTRGLDKNGKLRDPKAHPEHFKDSPLGRIPRRWDVRPLGVTATLQRGFDLPIQDRRAGNVPIFGSNGIDGRHNEGRVSGPGVITGRSGSIGFVYYTDTNFWPLNTTLYVKEFHGNRPKFIRLLLESLRLDRFAAATGVPSLNRNFVHPIEVTVPEPAEQDRIVDVVGAHDARIRTEEQYSDKLKLQKKGLMHDLLTGKVRVKV